MSDNTGRPSIYTEDLAKRICLELSEGLSLHAICREPWAPAISTVMAWRLDEGKIIDGKPFSEHYALAREAQADVYADKVGTIGYAVLAAELPSDAARVAIDAFKWTAGKMKPKSYGDKLVTENKTESVNTNLNASIAEVSQASDDQLLAARKLLRGE